MGKLKTKLNILLESDTKKIDNIINSAVSLCKIYCNDRDVVNISIPLILDELLRNAICHGNKSDTNKVVNIKIDISETEFIIIITDEGAGFNFKNQLKILSESSNVNSTSHGRGILLVIKYSESLIYSLKGKKVKVVVKYGR